jgi:hypothetical protein
MLTEGKDYTIQNGILDVITDERKYVKILTIDRNYAKNNDFYIYDDVKYSLVKKDQLDIWMILQSKGANNYIIKYPKSLLLVDKTKHKEIVEVKNVHPLSWRIDNPYFGKISGANIKPQMQDWLYVLPKIDSDETHFIFYVIPEEKMVDSDGNKAKSQTEKDQNMILYSKRVLVLDDVLSYSIKKLDFTPSISKWLILRNLKIFVFLMFV